MSTILTCPHGHRWDSLSDGGAWTNACPECGAAPLKEATLPLPAQHSALSRVKTENIAVPIHRPGDGTIGTAVEPKPAVGQPAIPGYEIMSVLGRGGMGVVYQARQVALKRVVALKMILAGAHAGPQDVARFRIEAEAVARLQHPNIVQVFEIGEWRAEDGTPLPFFSLEFVEGGSLDKKLAGLPQPPREAAAFLETVARAMHHAHQHGIIHRDLKPANILLVSGGVVSGEWYQEGTGPTATTHHSPRTTHQPKITDFGLAKQLDSEQGQTGSGTVLGTPSYMAPEQAAGRTRDFGPVTDVWALGAILYEMLTGRPPFRGETSVDTMLQVMTDEPVAPSRLQPKVPRDLETICLKCLQKEPRKRYASAEELAEDLRRFGANEPIQARPISLGQRGWKWAKRKPATAALIAVVCLAAVGLGVLAAGFTFSLRVERDTAQRERDTANDQRKVAEAAKADAQERLVQMHVANGIRRLDDGDWAGALPWFAEAMRLDAGRPERAEMHRIRLGTILRQCPRLLQLWAHKEIIYEAEFSSDGRRLLTSCADGVARLWDTRTGQLALPLPHPAAVKHVVFSPDGRLVATACPTEKIRIWNASTGTESAPALTHPADVHRLAFSPDGRRLAIASGDGIARIWEFETGKLRQLPKQALHISSVDFSPDGRRLATSTQGEPFEGRVWDSAAGQPVTPPLKHFLIVRQIVFSPDGTRVATVSSDQTARIWNSTTGQQVLPHLKHRDSVGHAVFSPDGRRLATASTDGMVHVWDTANGGHFIPPLRHESSANAAAFSPDGRRLASASSDGTARVWDLHTGRPLGPPLLHGGVIVSRVSFSPDGRRLATACADGTARVWESAAGAALSDESPVNALVAAEISRDGRRLLLRGKLNLVIKEAPPGKPPLPLRHPDEVNDASFSPDGQRVVTVCADGNARLWDAATGKPLGAPWRRPFSDKFQFLPDGRRLLACGLTVQILDAETGLPAAPPREQPFFPRQMALSPDGRWLAVAGELKEQWQTWLWDLESTSAEPARIWKHPAEIHHLVFSPTGDRLATAADDGHVRLWEPRTGRQTTVLKRVGKLSYVAFDPAGRRVLIAGDDNSARVWDAATGQPLTPPLWHSLGVTHASFRADGRCLVTASSDRTARVWDAETGEPLSPPLPHGERLMRAAFDSSGRVVTVARDGVVRVWDVRPDPRPVEDLLLHAQLVSAAHVTADRGLLPLEKSALQNAWQRLRQRYPDEFNPRKAEIDSDRSALVWHQHQAMDCGEMRHWFAALWHLERVVPALPQEWLWHVRRGTALAELGHLERAAADFARAIELGAQDRNAWMLHAILRLQVGDAAGYRQFCVRLVERSRKEKDPEAAHRAAWCCVAAPDSVADAAAVVQLAETALAAEPKNVAYLCDAGAAHFRAGDDDTALKRLAEAVRLHSTGGSPNEWLFLALVCQRLGRAAEAQEWLQRAAARLDRWTRDRQQDAPGAPMLAWNVRLRMQLLRREAEAALKNARP